MLVERSDGVGGWASEAVNRDDLLRLRFRWIRFFAKTKSIALDAFCMCVGCTEIGDLAEIINDLSLRCHK